MKRILILLAAACAFALVPVSASAQGGYEITGTVVDEIGPVVGVSIVEKGTQNVTVTDMDGNFALKVASADAIVEISCIGYTTHSYKASEVPSSGRRAAARSFRTPRPDASTPAAEPSAPRTPGRDPAGVTGVPAPAPPASAGLCP